MPKRPIVKKILDDMNKTITELQTKNLVRDYRGISTSQNGKKSYEITYNGKNTDISNIVYDKHISQEELMRKLLKGLQYTILMYDKSIIQSEFIIDNDKIIKERLVFMKRHNRVWDINEITDYDRMEHDWFEEEKGIPIIFRIDYAPNDHIEKDHAATHVTLSNHETCRIPMKGIVTFSEFIRFILFHFYNIKLDLNENRLNIDDTITELEKKMIHINWV